MQFLFYFGCFYIGSCLRLLIDFQSDMKGVFRIIPFTNTSCPGIYCNIVWWLPFTLKMLLCFFRESFDHVASNFLQQCDHNTNVGISERMWFFEGLHHTLLGFAIFIILVGVGIKSGSRPAGSNPIYHRIDRKIVAFSGCQCHGWKQLVDGVAMH